MAIDRVKVRAEVSFFGGLVIKTPYILSFTVNRNRGTYSTADLNLKVKGDSLPSIRSDVSIEAGEEGHLKQIFTGFVIDMTIKPVWDDPTYLNLSIKCADVLYFLTDKKFTRRQISHEQSWALITTVQPGLKSGRFNVVNAPNIMFSGDTVTGGEFIGSPIVPPTYKENAPTTGHVKTKGVPIGTTVNVKTSGGTNK